MMGNSATISQTPWVDLPDDLWDVLIVGAGPAGATAALHLAERGHRVLLIDREAFPREKICGDGLLPDALQALERAGLTDTVRAAGHSVAKLAVFSPAGIEVEIPCAGVTIRRRLLDTLLAGTATERGAVFARGEIIHLLRETDGTVTAALRDGQRPIRARYALLATGARLALPRRTGLADPAPPDAFAVRCYVRSDLPLDRMVVSYDRSILPGYAWIFPLGEGLFNIGCGLFQPRCRRGMAGLSQAFDAFTRSFSPARQLLGAGKAVTPLRGWMLRSGLNGARPVGVEGVLAAGEAIGTTFPLTGEGVGKAMESGELAAEVLHRTLAAGSREMIGTFPGLLQHRLGPRYLGYRTAEKWLTRAWVADFLALRARKSRYFQEAMRGILQETVDPREVFSLRGILRSFLS